MGYVTEYIGNLLLSNDEDGLNVPFNFTKIRPVSSWLEALDFPFLRAFTFKKYPFKYKSSTTQECISEDSGSHPLEV